MQELFYTWLSYSCCSEQNGPEHFWGARTAFGHYQTQVTLWEDTMGTFLLQGYALKPLYMVSETCHTAVPFTHSNHNMEKDMGNDYFRQTV